MATLTYPTEASIPGPWLIGEGQLQALDSLYDSYLPKLQKERDALVEQKTEEILLDSIAGTAPQEHELARLRIDIRNRVSNRSSIGGEERAVTIYIPGGRTLQTIYFHEATNHPHTSDEKPLGFRSYLRVGEISVDVKLSGRWDNELNIRVRPNEHPLAQELFGALRNWASDLQAPRWQQMWLKFSWLPRFLLFIWLVLAGMAPLATTDSNWSESYKKEAHQLLDRGITPANQQRAIELLLAINSDYGRVHQKVGGPRFWSYIVFGTLILGALSKYPTLVIGIWKGKEKLKWWRMWIQAVSVTVPGLVLTTVVWPWILRWLRILPGAP